MITNFKLYEEDTIEDRLPQVNDYTICKEEKTELNQFISTNIGQIIKITINNVPSDSVYLIQYENVPYELKHYFNSISAKIHNVRPFYINEINHFSPIKDDLEIILTAKNYNL